MKLACPEIHKRSVSGWGNITGGGSGPAPGSDAAAELCSWPAVTSCAAVKGAHEKHSAARITHWCRLNSRYFFRILGFGRHFRPSPWSWRAALIMLTENHKLF